MMRLVIVTGLSGAGKSQALSAFEDMGFFTMDNLPPQLIPGFIDLCAASNAGVEDIAVVVDTRSGVFLGGLDEAMGTVQGMDVPCEILYFDAQDDVLIKRYKETRRLHPLAQGSAVLEAIRRERDILRPVRDRAQHVLDTSSMLVRELREELRALYRPNRERAAMDISVVSFGYKHGLPPDADLVLDVRFVPNPFYVDVLRPLTGRDTAVRDYVMSKPETSEFITRVLPMLQFLLPCYVREGKTQLVIAIGCTGGRHRSVAIADAVAQGLSQAGFEARVEHRDVQRAAG